MKIDRPFLRFRDLETCVALGIRLEFGVGGDEILKVMGGWESSAQVEG